MATTFGSLCGGLWAGHRGSRCACRSRRAGSIIADRRDHGRRVGSRPSGLGAPETGPELWCGARPHETPRWDRSHPRRQQPPRVPSNRENPGNAFARIIRSEFRRYLPSHGMQREPPQTRLPFSHRLASCLGHDRRRGTANGGPAHRVGRNAMLSRSAIPIGRGTGPFGAPFHISDPPAATCTARRRCGTSRQMRPSARWTWRPTPGPKQIRRADSHIPGD